MKKFISFLMAAVLCFGMTTAVMAAESPSVVISAVDSENFTVVTNNTKSDADVKAELAKAGHTPNVLASVWAEIDRVDGQTTAANVKLYVNGCVAGEEWIAYVGDGAGNWEATKAKVVQGGIIEIQMPHFSPVILVKVANAPVVVPAPDTTSPKTADVAMFGLYAAVALAGTVTAARKAKASK